MHALSKIFLITSILVTLVNAENLFCDEDSNIDYCDDIKKVAYKQGELMLYITNNIYDTSYITLRDSKSTRSIAKQIHKTMYAINKGTKSIFNDVKKNHKDLDIELRSALLKNRKSTTLKKSLEKSYKVKGIRRYYKYMEEYEDNFIKDLLIVNNAKGIFYPEIAELDDFVDELNENKKAVLIIDLWYSNIDKGATSKSIQIKAKKISKKYKFEDPIKVKNLLKIGLIELMSGQLKAEESLEDDF